MPTATEFSPESWPVQAPLGAALILAASVYLRGWVHLRRHFSTTSQAWRAASFLSGLFVVWVAVGSPLATLDAELLSAHMAQHLLLMTLAPPLILLGAPSMAFRLGLPAFMRDIPGPLLSSPAVHRFGGILAAPLFCLLAATAVLIGWHLPVAYNLGLQSHSWHAIEHASFFAAGILFWWPVILPTASITPGARWSIVLYLFLATLPCDVLSAFLAFCDRVVCTSYLDVPRPFNISALQDQEFAGVLMWVCVTFAYLIPAVFLTARLLSTHESEKERLHSNGYEGSAQQHTFPADRSR